MNKQRLIAALHSSPLWLTPGHPVHCCHGKPESAQGVDVTWYWRTFRQARPESFTPEDCIADYWQHAAPAYRSPNLAFDEFWYRHQYPAVERLVKTGEFRSGWQHYLEEGARKQYNPVFWFDEQWYQRTYPEVREAIVNRSLVCGFEHFLLYGIREDLAPSIYFNVEWYREQYGKEIDAANASFPIVHYLFTDRKTRACPVPFFHPDWYTQQYLTDSSAETDPLPAYEHYMVFGRGLRYSPSPYFNESAYLEIYPEVAKQLEAGLYASGFEHYVSDGPANGFLPKTHLNLIGADYAGPRFIESYRQNLLLHLSQLRKLHDFAESW